MFDIARKGTLEKIQNLYKKNPALINSVDDKKSSALILAGCRANVDVAFFFANHVEDLKYNSGMETALMAAMMSGNFLLGEKLIAEKADLNQADIGRKTVLIYATFFKKSNIVHYIIDAVASKNLKDSDGRTALANANFNKNTELLFLL